MSLLGGFPSVVSELSLGEFQGLFRHCQIDGILLFSSDEEREVPGCCNCVFYSRSFIAKLRFELFSGDFITYFSLHYLFSLHHMSAYTWRFKRLSSAGSLSPPSVAAICPVTTCK